MIYVIPCSASCNATFAAAIISPLVLMVGVSYARQNGNSLTHSGLIEVSLAFEYVRYFFMLTCYILSLSTLHTVHRHCVRTASMTMY